MIRHVKVAVIEQDPGMNDQDLKIRHKIQHDVLPNWLASSQ